MKTHIITIATNSELYFPYLVDSCKKNGIPLTVLGYGEKWTGFTFRFDKMIPKHWFSGKGCNNI